MTPLSIDIVDRGLEKRITHHASRITDQEIHIVVAAAMKRELAPLRRQAHRHLALLHMGEGIENAERRLGGWLGQRSVHAVISIGVAGALSPSLRIGDLVIARTVQGVVHLATSPELLSLAEQVRIEGVMTRVGTVMTVDEVIGEAGRKRSLARALASREIGCVDMESAAIAQVCAEQGVPFLIVRCISDELDEDLPLDFNRCRRADGSLNSMKIVSTALRRPRSLKGLWELRRRSHVCAERLALFVEHLLAAGNLWD